MALITIILILGICTTIASGIRNEKLHWDGCNDAGLSQSQVMKGYPLPYILVRPSVSICQPVEKFSILLEGNAYHEEYYRNFLINFPRPDGRGISCFKVTWGYFAQHLLGPGVQCSVWWSLHWCQPWRQSSLPTKYCQYPSKPAWEMGTRPSYHGQC